MEHQLKERNEGTRKFTQRTCETDFKRTDQNMRKAVSAILLVLLFVFVLPYVSFAEQKDKDRGEFKIIGYYSGDLFDEPVESLQTDKLTHIIYAFLIPTPEGGCLPLEKPEQLESVVEKAHKDGTKVFIALGGWSYQGGPLVSVFEKVAGDDLLREKLVESVLETVRLYDLDGVELDWEHPMAHSADSYEALVVDLSHALSKEGKELSAALNGAWSTTAGPETSNYISPTCLNAFSFICVMGYDMNNEEHSPFWFADTSIGYWIEKQLPSEKIVLGMPLYARPSWIQYRHLVEMDRENAYNDYAATTPLVSYYNGLPTLCRKTVLAFEKAGGVMLFDVNEDAQGDLSAVSMIKETVDQIRSNGYLSGWAEEAVQSPELRKSISDGKSVDVFFIQSDLFGKETAVWSYMNPGPVLSENRALVPVRALSEKLGFSVQWNPQEKTVLLEGKGRQILLTLGSDQALVTEENGEIRHVILDVSVRIDQERTIVPLRFVSEQLGCQVIWEESDRRIMMKKE